MKIDIFDVISPLKKHFTLTLEKYKNICEEHLNENIAVSLLSLQATATIIWEHPLNNLFTVCPKPFFPC